VPVIPEGLSGLYHITVIGEHLGNRTQNGFYFIDAEGGLIDDHATSLATIINDFMDWCIEPMRLFASSSWHINGIVGLTLIPRNGPLAELGPLALSGGQDAESLPADCAGCLAISSGFAGRSNRGRTYVPAISKTSCDGDFLTADSLALLQAFGDALIGRFGGFGSSHNHRLVVYSRKLGDIRHAGPPPYIEATWQGPTIANHSHARRLICSQRHRRPDRGI
jgi:hypothetical protein